MFDYTKTAVEKIKNDFLKIIFACNVFAQGLYVTYLIIALYFGAGNAIVNGILLGMSSAYLAFYLFMYFRESKGAKKTKKIVDVVYRRSKQFLKLYTLAASIYAIILTGDNTNHFTILVTAFMLITLVLQVLLEIVYKLVVDRLTLLREGMMADVEPFTKTIRATGNLLKKLKGEEIEPEPEKNKHREWLDKKVIDYRKDRAEEKAAKKLVLKEQKAAKKLAEKQEKEEKKNKKRKKEE